MRKFARLISMALALPLLLLAAVTRFTWSVSTWWADILCLLLGAVWLLLFLFGRKSSADLYEEFRHDQEALRDSESKVPGSK